MVEHRFGRPLPPGFGYPDVAFMALPPQTKLGAFEIIAALGAGGMGEVYRAHDTRLKRDVAIKVLPAAVAGDAERVQRFELEAQAAGRLNHPNVLTVYDVGMHDGAPYLVTELLDGEPLRERIAQGALPLRKVLDIGRQIALGLAAAHGAGIVHRDLKPENVFLTTDGRAKILDFGLARMTERASADGQSTTLQVTSPGMVLGTVGYMSPEQVRGRTADARSDLFALGAILFEMAGGRRAFARDSTADTMAAILKEDPPDLSGSGVVIPPAFERLIRRCLEKNPDERFQSARDLAFAIDALEGSSPATAGSPGVAAALEPAASGRRLTMPVLMAAAVVIAIASFIAGRNLRSTPGTATAAHSRGELRQVTFTGSNLGLPALAPDGSTIAFVDAAGDNAEIHLLRVGGENAINLTRDPANDTHPAFSPDGRQIAFGSDRAGGGLFVMGAMGESPRRVTSDGFNPAWSPDGRELAYSSQVVVDPTGRTPPAELWRVDVASGAKTKVFDGDAVQPSWSPDGRFLVFWGLPGATGRRAIMTVAAGGGPPTTLTEDASMNWNPIWSRDGQFVFFLSDREPPMNVWRIPVDRATGAPRGVPERVTFSTAPVSWLSQEGGGALVFAASHTVSTVERRALSLSTGAVGAPEAIMRTARQLGSGVASPDGRSIVIIASDHTEDLLTFNVDGTGVVRLMTDQFRDRMPSWSADSSTIYFASDRSGQYDIWRIRRDGSGLEQVTRRTVPEMFASARVSPDGRHLAVTVLKPTMTAALIDLTRPIEQRTMDPLLPPAVPAAFLPLGWLSDGRLVGELPVTGKDAAVILYNPASRSAQVFPTPGLHPAVVVGDRYVACADDRNGVHFLDLTTGTIATTKFTQTFDGFVAPDGRTLYELRTETVTNLWMIRP